MGSIPIDGSNYHFLLFCISFAAKYVTPENPASMAPAFTDPNTIIAVPTSMPATSTFFETSRPVSTQDLPSFIQKVYIVSYSPSPHWFFMPKEIVTPQEKLVHELVSNGQVYAHYSRLTGRTPTGISIVDGTLYKSMKEVNAKEAETVMQEEPFIKGVLQFIMPKEEENLVWLEELDKYVLDNKSEGTIYLHGVHEICKIEKQTGDGIVHGGNAIHVFKPSLRNGK